MSCYRLYLSGITESQMQLASVDRGDRRISGKDIFMKNFTLSALALGAAAITFAAPAQAATCVLADVTPTAVACAGYDSGNSIFNTANNSVVQGLLSDLGYGSLMTNAQLTSLWSNSGLKLSGLGGASNISFSGAPVLFGTTIIGIHWGGQGGGQNALYVLNFASAVGSFMIDPQNPGGSSDVVLFSTGTPPVPEAATWAMMVAGLGIVGAAMRRRKTAVSFA